MKKTIFTAVVLVAVFAALGSCATGGGGGGGGGGKDYEAAARKFVEGDYYAYLFEQYKQEEADSVKNATITFGSNGRVNIERTNASSTVLNLSSNYGAPTGGSVGSVTKPRQYGEAMDKPSWMGRVSIKLVETIDMAIAAYEESLRLQPSGTWKVSSDNQELRAPEGGVQVRLAQAQKVKEQWPVEKQELERQFNQRVASVRQENTAAVAQAQQAEATRQAEERAEQERRQQAEQQAIEEQRRLASTQTTPNSPNDFDIANSALGGVKITRYKGTRPGVVIPATIEGMRVTEIDDYSFWAVDYNDRRTNITIIYNIVFPNTLIRIGQAAFLNQQLSSVSFPSSLQTIGGSAFQFNNITSLVIPNGVTYVGGGSFTGNPLTTVVIPPSLANYEGPSGRGNVLNTTKGFRQFHLYCENLTRITLPANVHPLNFENAERSLYPLRDAYEGNGRRAGTYVWTGRIWRTE